MFKSVARNLPDKTIFLFDMNTRDHVSAFQQNAPIIFEDNESYTTFRYSGKDRLWKIDIDLFFKQPSGLFKHYKEHHVEKGYNEEDILPMLKKQALVYLKFEERIRLMRMVKNI